MQYERLVGQSLPKQAIIVSVWRNNGSYFADLACFGCGTDQRIVADFPKPLTRTLERATVIATACGLSTILIATTSDAVWHVVEDRMSRLGAERNSGPELTHAHPRVA